MWQVFTRSLLTGLLVVVLKFPHFFVSQFLGELRYIALYHFPVYIRRQAHTNFQKKENRTATVRLDTPVSHPAKSGSQHG